MEEAKRFFCGLRNADGHLGNIYVLFDMSNDFSVKNIEGTMSDMLMYIEYKKDLGLNITYSFNYGTCLIHDISTNDKFFFKLSEVKQLVSVCKCIEKYGLGNILYKNLNKE